MLVGAGQGPCTGCRAGLGLLGLGFERRLGLEAGLGLGVRVVHGLELGLGLGQQLGQRGPRQAI